MSDYYVSPTDLAPGTRARSSDINLIDQAVESAFGLLPSPAALRLGTISYAVNTSIAANNYAVAMNPLITGYVDGFEVRLRPTMDNTGAATLNVNDIGNIPIKRADGTDPQAGDMQAAATIHLSYSSALNAFILPPVVASQLIAGAAAVATATEAATLAAAWATSLAAVAGGFFGARKYALDAADAASAAALWATSGAVVANGYFGARKYALDASSAAAAALQSAQEAATSAATTGAGQVQADWNEASTASKSYIWNKPNLTTYAPKASPTFTGAVNVPTPAISSAGTLAASAAYVIARIAQDAMPAGAKPETAGVADSANKLNGQAYTDGVTGWFRSTGITGWFNETYAVGIYAREVGWVRTYNNANFGANNIEAGGNFFGPGGGLTGTGANFTAGNANKLAGYSADFNAFGGTVPIRDGSGNINVVSINATTFATNLNDTWSWNGQNVATYGMSVRGYNGGQYTIFSGYSGIAFGVGNIERVFMHTGGMNVAGEVAASGNITAFSDERFKINWRPVAESAEKYVRQLALVKHGIYDRTDINLTQAGVSAQSFKKLLPDAVPVNDKGIHSVNYGQGSMVNSIELAIVVTYLMDRLEDLTAQLKGLQGK